MKPHGNGGRVPIRLTSITKTLLITAWIFTGGAIDTYIIDTFEPTFTSTCALTLVLLTFTALPIVLTLTALMGNSRTVTGRRFRRLLYSSDASLR